MKITIRTGRYPITPVDEAILEEKLVAPLRLLRDTDDDETLLDIDVEHAPPEGRSATPCRLVANLTVGGTVYHAEAVKPTPECAADRVRSTLEAEIRRARGRTRRLWLEGSMKIKRMLHMQ